MGKIVRENAKRKDGWMRPMEPWDRVWLVLGSAAGDRSGFRGGTIHESVNPSAHEAAGTSVHDSEKSDGSGIASGWGSGVLDISVVGRDLGEGIGFILHGALLGKLGGLHEYPVAKDRSDDRLTIYVARCRVPVFAVIHSGDVGAGVASVSIVYDQSEQSIPVESTVQGLALACLQTSMGSYALSTRGTKESISWTFFPLLETSGLLLDESMCETVCGWRPRTLVSVLTEGLGLCVGTFPGNDGNVTAYVTRQRRAVIARGLVRKGALELSVLICICLGGWGWVGGGGGPLHRDAADSTVSRPTTMEDLQATFESIEIHNVDRPDCTGAYKRYEMMDVMSIRVIESTVCCHRFMVDSAMKLEICLGTDPSQCDRSPVLERLIEHKLAFLGPMPDGTSKIRIAFGLRTQVVVKWINEGLFALSTDFESTCEDERFGDHTPIPTFEFLTTDPGWIVHMCNTNKMNHTLAMLQTVPKVDRAMLETHEACNGNKILCRAECRSAANLFCPDPWERCASECFKGLSDEYNKGGSLSMRRFMSSKTMRLEIILVDPHSSDVWPSLEEILRSKFETLAPFEDGKARLTITSITGPSRTTLRWIRGGIFASWSMLQARDRAPTLSLLFKDPRWILHIMNGSMIVQTLSLVQRLGLSPLSLEGWEPGTITMSKNIANDDEGSDAADLFAVWGSCSS
ncbi:hypothetical protein BDK51DRAFT_35248 [Blyttiomyces helicus]|uniref:Uncharacterized protein n=1 Tax=Blyttiomyces helicus TaxID=388810 RepID=A0A4P9WHN4_9FUNG|nr:hypothetical protein BDK51DRAFT_35248 [Blyttiomyces helicus]|eukprot:RKO90938.1 hypothetical protein BDK51DRAFT_35248 [Blyttiomyces helicus]